MGLRHGTLRRRFLQRRVLMELRSAVRDEQTFRGLCLDMDPSLFLY
jgi:hypothetical protein